MKNTIAVIVSGLMLAPLANAQSWMGGAVRRDDSQLMSQDRTATTDERSLVASFEGKVKDAELALAVLINTEGKSAQEQQFAQTVSVLMVATSGLDNTLKETAAFGNLKAVARGVVTNFLDDYSAINGTSDIQGDLTNLQDVFDRLSMGAIEDASNGRLMN